MSRQNPTNVYQLNGSRRDSDGAMEELLPDVGRARTVATAAKPLGGIRALRGEYDHLEVHCEDTADIADCWDA